MNKQYRSSLLSIQNIERLVKDNKRKKLKLKYDKVKKKVRSKNEFLNLLKNNNSEIDFTIQMNSEYNDDYSDKLNLNVKKYNKKRESFFHQEMSMNSINDLEQDNYNKYYKRNSINLKRKKFCLNLNNISKFKDNTNNTINNTLSKKVSILPKYHNNIKDIEIKNLKSYLNQKSISKNYSIRKRQATMRDKTSNILIKINNKVFRNWNNLKKKIHNTFNSNNIKINIIKCDEPRKKKTMIDFRGKFKNLNKIYILNDIKNNINNIKNNKKKFKNKIFK